MVKMRIDVYHQPAELEAELDVLYQRIHTPGDLLHGLPQVETSDSSLVFRYREADGEYYVYVEDIAARCLAGYTVFNRLVELSRRADPHLRAPHSKYAPAWQRRGIATAVYRWGLDAGLCLISGARQSTGANALWYALAKQHDLIFVELRNKELRCLGREVSTAIHDDLHTRMVLLGGGWSMEALTERVGMRISHEDKDLSIRPGRLCSDVVK